MFSVGFFTFFGIYLQGASLKVATGNTLMWSNPEKKGYLLWTLQKESSLIFLLYILEKKKSVYVACCSTHLSMQLITNVELIDYNFLR